MIGILLENYSHADYPCVLASCDVVSLYTSIPHDLGLEAFFLLY